jgi:hyperosmotically inducible protein
MKPSKLLVAILPLVFIAACAGTPAQPGPGGEPAKRSTGVVIDDAAITAKVKAALLADADIKALVINVDTAKGVVSLKGEIKTLALRRKAEALAREVEGVKSVVNQLVVTG